MKTAMQELIEWTGQYEGKMISADQVILKAYELLEKEKNLMFHSFYGGNGFDESLGDCEILFEEYYQETFNQNK